MRSPETGEYTGGFLPAFFQVLANTAKLELHMVPYQNAAELLVNYSNIMHECVQNNTLDLGFVAASAGVVLRPGFSFSTPFSALSTSVITKRVQRKSGMWQVFAPFELDLWLAIWGAVSIGGIVMMLINRVHRGPGRRRVVEEVVLSSSGVLESGGASAPREEVRAATRTQQDLLYQFIRFPAHLYHAYAALLGGDEYDLYHDPPLGRLYRLGLLFLVLVIQNTYTANLAAFLTSPTVQVLGPKTMQQLSDATCCLRWPSLKEHVSAFVGHVITPGPEVPVEIDELVAWGQKMLQEEKCDCLIEGEADARTEVLRSCDTMEFHPDLTFAPTPAFLVSRGDSAGREIATRLSNATLQIIPSRDYQNLQVTWLKKGRSCSSEVRTSGGSSAEDDVPKVRFQSMGGVFLIFGFVSGLALLMTVCRRVLVTGRGTGVLQEEVQNEKLDEKLERVLARLGRLETELLCRNRKTQQQQGSSSSTELGLVQGSSPPSRGGEGGTGKKNVELRQGI